MFDPLSWLRFWKPRLRNRSVLVATLVWLLSVAGSFTGPADASVITTGDVDPGGAAAQPDPWAVGGTLKVGNSGNGTLSITAGGEVTNHHGYIGYSAGSIGEATVTGFSGWTYSGVLSVGHRGSGTLNITAGGEVTNTSASYDGFIGRHPGSIGEATVTGVGSQWSNSDDLWIGGNDSGAGGSGTLNLYDSGFATVTNTTKLWNTGTLNLDGGSGWFNLPGGNLTTGSFDNSEAGTFNFHDGTLTVNGAGGVFNPGTIYFVIDGKAADDTPHLVIANTATTTLAGDLTVGQTFQGFLNVESGGVVSNMVGYIGGFSGSTGEATVTGEGSQWNNSTSLWVGNFGTGTLNVTDGGVVVNTIGYIGVGSGSTSMATITGSGSRWYNSSDLYVGDSGAGTLNVEAGGVVSNTEGHIGYGSVSTGTAMVTGSGSQWNNSSYLFVGYEGTGKLNIKAGGVVENSRTGILGYSPGSTGEVTVSGTNSQWNNSGPLYVGRKGFGTLNVTDGGVVTASSPGGYIGYSSGGGIATVTGLGSQWNNSHEVAVGYSGTGTLNVEAGGVVSNTSRGYIGYKSGSTGVVTVTGTNSQWNNSSNLTVSSDGTGTLNIADDGLVTVGGTTSIGATGSVNLTGGRFEFGQTTLAEFSTINATSGSMAGDVVITGVNDVSSLTALQNSLVELNEVTAANEGLLYGSAILKSSLDNRTTGEVEMMNGARMQFRGVGNINKGEINNFGGQIRFDQDLTNQADGFIGGRGQFVADGGWINQGVMAFSGTTDILGDVVNDVGGQIITLGGTTTTIFDDLLHNGQEIRTGVGSRTVVFGQASGAGAYNDVGIVEFVHVFSPGNSPGAVSFGGDVVLGPTSTTQIELGGTVRGDEHDAMIVSGDFTLDGSLDVLSIDGYVPQAGDLFDILDFAPENLSGSFNAVSLPALASDLEWDQANLYTTGELLVSLSQLLGDFNQDSIIDVVDIDLLRLAINTGSADPIYDVNGGGLDGTDFDYEVQSIIGSAFGDADLNQQVNFTDFVSLSTNFGSSGTGWAQGNFNLDFRTDFIDFVLLANNYGIDLSSGVSAQETVPEPASLVLLSLAVGFVARRRRGIKYPISD